MMDDYSKKGENCKGGSGARGILSTSRRNSPAHIVVAADHSGLCFHLRNAVERCNVLADAVIGHYGTG